MAQSEQQPGSSKWQLQVADGTNTPPTPSQYPTQSPPDIPPNTHFPIAPSPPNTCLIPPIYASKKETCPSFSPVAHLEQGKLLHIRNTSIGHRLGPTTDSGLLHIFHNEAIPSWSITCPWGGCFNSRAGTKHCCMKYQNLVACHLLEFLGAAGNYVFPVSYDKKLSYTCRNAHTKERRATELGNASRLFNT